MKRVVVFVCLCGLCGCSTINSVSKGIAKMSAPETDKVDMELSVSESIEARLCVDIENVRSFGNEQATELGPNFSHAAINELRQWLFSGSQNIRVTEVDPVEKPAISAPASAAVPPVASKESAQAASEMKSRGTAKQHVEVATATAVSSDPAIQQSAVLRASSYWQYEVRFEEIQFIRLGDGNRGIAVDASLQILDDQNQLLYRSSYNFPAKDERFTDEEIKQQIQDSATTIRFLESIQKEASPIPNGAGKTVVNTIVNTVKYGEKEKLVRRWNNLRRDDVKGLQDYQFQEKAIKKAIAALLEKAPAPGKTQHIIVPYKFKSVPQKELQRTAEEYIKKQLPDEAIACWEKFEKDVPEKSYNLGVAYLIKANSSMRANVPQAITFLGTSEECFKKAAVKYSKESDLLTAPTDVKHRLERMVMPADAGAPTAPVINPLAPPKSKYALLIGIGKVAPVPQPPAASDPAPAPPEANTADATAASEPASLTFDELPGARKDVEIMRTTLQKSGFKEVITLVDEKATRYGICRALDELRKKCDENSLTIVCLSGHGFIPEDSRNKEGFIVCYDSTANDIDASGYSMQAFVDNIMGRIPGRKIVFQDTCESGSQDRYRGCFFEPPQRSWEPCFGLFTACDKGESAGEEVNGGGCFMASVSRLYRANGKTPLSKFQKKLETEVQRKNPKQHPQAFFSMGADQMLLNP